MAMTRRNALGRLTKPELIQLGKKYKLEIPSSTTKTGMISILMIAGTANVLVKESDKILMARK